MMVMTAKLNLKKLMLILGAAAAVILILILLLGGGQAQETSAYDSNLSRVEFLKELGWEASQEPVESSRVRMPRETSAVYERYNNLQKSQGYDLSDFAGKKAMRYVYELRNVPGAAGPVYATLLVYQDQIIGGDVTDTGAGGKIRALRRSPEPTEKKPVPAASAESTPAPVEIPQ